MRAYLRAAWWARAWMCAVNAAKHKGRRRAVFRAKVRAAAALGRRERALRATVGAISTAAR